MERHTEILNRHSRETLGYNEFEHLINNGGRGYKEAILTIVTRAMEEVEKNQQEIIDDLVDCNNDACKRIMELCNRPQVSEPKVILTDNAPKIKLKELREKFKLHFHASFDKSFGDSIPLSEKCDIFFDWFTTELKLKEDSK